MKTASCRQITLYLFVSVISLQSARSGPVVSLLRFTWVDGGDDEDQVQRQRERCAIPHGLSTRRTTAATLRSRRAATQRCGNSVARVDQFIGWQSSHTQAGRCALDEPGMHPAAVASSAGRPRDSLLAR